MIMVLIAAAIGSVIAMVMASLITNAQLGQSNVEFRSEADDMAGEVGGILSNPVSCLATFSGKAPSGGTLNEIRRAKTGGGYDVRFTVGTTYGNHSTKLVLLPFDSFSPGSAAGSGTVVLKINTAASQKSLGSQVALRSININLTYSGTTITGCVASAKWTDGIWQRTSTNQNNIFFAGPSSTGAGGGLVGINNPAPTAMLDIVTAAGVNMLRLTNGSQKRGLALVSDDNGYGTWGNPEYANTTGFANNAGYANTANYANSSNQSNITTYFYSQNTPGNIMWWNFLGGCDGSNPAFPCANSWGLMVDGKLVKTFVIDHPTDPARYLVHGTLEGPEGAVFYRGEGELLNGRAEITLPAYFEALTRPAGRTVQLTAIDGFDPLTVETKGGAVIANGRFTVRSNVARSRQRFHWQVMAVRADVDPLLVEPRKDEYEVHGVGPYTYGKPVRPGGGTKSAVERELATKDEQIQALRHAICEVNPNSRVCAR